MAKSDLQHRVIQLPEPLRDAMQKARDSNNQTNAAFLAEAVTNHLPKLVEGLQALGYDKLNGKRRPARLPFSSDAGTLLELKKAGEKVQLPSIQLLLLCIAAACEQSVPTKRRGGRRKKNAPASEK